METIEAYWEKRNFGFDAYEVNLTKDDCVDVDWVLSVLNKEQYKCAYVTVKMPVGNLVALHKLEDAGFRFMETQFRMMRDIAHYETPSQLSMVENDICQFEVSKNRKSWKMVTDMISDGMFHTDRIFLDEIFEYGTSVKRYRNWINDMVDDPTMTLNLYSSNSEYVGFDMQKIDYDKMTMEGVLGGIFEQYLDTGLGLFMFDVLLKNARERRIRKLFTNVSSNNPSIVRQNLFFGYKIIWETYVLRRK